MISLFMSTILTSAADSLNPIAITQQFFLQGLVKKAKDIWYFIIAIGFTNFLGGILVYFGAINIFMDIFQNYFSNAMHVLRSIEIVCGVLILVFFIRVIIKRRHTKNDAQPNVNKKAIAVTPLALILLGISMTLSELTTALPYFAFLTILSSYQLSAIITVLLLVFYNIIYSLPLIIMYFIYILARDKFDNLYQCINKLMHKINRYLVPALLFIVGITLIIHGTFMYYLG